MEWSVYILRCADGSLYTGITKDVKKRVEVHNSGLGAKYTRTRLPVKPVYVEKAPDRSSALRRELQIKVLTRKQKLALIGEYEAGETAKDKSVK